MRDYITSEIRSLLTNIDWVVFLLISFITSLAVIYGSLVKKQRKTEKETIKSIKNSDSTIVEHIIMGRKLTLPLFVATLVASWYGGIFGVTQIAFEYGIYNFVTQGLFWYISYIIFALFFVKKIRKFNATTLPELIKKIYGERSAKLSAIFIFFKTIPISYAISIGILIKAIIPISFVNAVIIGVSFVMMYSYLGGLRSVVFSDVIQFITMCIGIISVVIFSISKFGGFSFLQANLPKEHFYVNGYHSITTSLVWLFIASSITFVNPTFYQRCFAAKTTKTAMVGIIISTIIWLIFDICTTLGGMYARATMATSNSLDAYLIYSINLLPNGWRGLFLASIVATVLSTLDSFLLIASSTLSYDIFNVKKIKNINKFLFIFVTGLLSIILACYCDSNFENIWRTTKSYFSVCLLCPLIFGYIFPKKLSDNNFIYSSIITCGVMTFWKYLEHCKIIYNVIDSFYVGNIVMVVCLLILYHIKPQLKKYTHSISKRSAANVVHRR